jgi:hypothetical protein
MLEETLQAQIIELATMLGWMHFHPYDSRKSVPGFPDLVLAHERTGALIFAELKSDSGRVTRDQRRWLGVLGMRHTAVVWRPEHLRAGIVGRQLRQAVRAAS